MAATLLVCKSSSPLCTSLPSSSGLIADAAADVTLTLSVCLQFASHWHFNLFPPFLRLMQSTYPPSLPPLPALYRLQKCLIGSGHNFSIRINYVRRQRKMAASATGRRCRQMRFSKFTRFPFPLALHKHSAWSPNGTCNYYANYNCNFLCTSWGGEGDGGDKKETENGEICEFNLWLHCHEQNWVRACLSHSAVSPNPLPPGQQVQ